MAVKPDEFKLEMKMLEETVVSKFHKIREMRGEPIPTGIISVNSAIGGKMEGYINVRNKTYNSADELLDAYCAAINPKDVILDFIKDDECRRYFELFIRRYYEKHKEAIKKVKPPVGFYDLWFGDNNNLFELLITPVYRMNYKEQREVWENDESEIRKANFNYWSVQHLLTTGVIDKIHNTHISFVNIDSLIDFYKRNFYDNSKSIYEREIMKKYFDLLKGTNNYNNIAFLFPELRLLKGELKHKSRLDFAIIKGGENSENIGFEISPDSTHAYTQNIKDKDESTVKNEEITRWHKEMSKINDFHKKYDISIRTFLQEELADMDKCFEVMKEYIVIANIEKDKGAWKRLCEEYKDM